MLANKHDCYCILLELKDQGQDVSNDLNEIIQDNSIPKTVIKELIKRDNNVVRFYLNLNNKAHKIIKEILSCEGKSVSTYIKIATSIITQGVISMEHLYESDINGQNDFIECLGLKDLSNGISVYFQTGDYKPLVDAVNRNKYDVKSLLDNRD